MDNPQQNPRPVDETVKEKAAKSSKRVEVNFWRAFRWFVLFILVACIIFFWQQWKTISLSAPIDSSIFGTLGDFIGGIMGTIIAFYSVYLLVRTFQSQNETNASVIETNESVVRANENMIITNKKLVQQTQIQIFDSRFNTFLNLYHKSIDAYYCKDGQIELKGRACFEKYALDFKNSGFCNHTEYKRRSMGAVSEYMALYVKHRNELSVHYRTLYLLSRLTAEEKMREDLRVSYAKSIRGQLSEGELLLLRYNCLSPYGERMRTYVNQFNLLKHLPIMSLLEFTYWRNMVAEDDKISSLDQLALSLKQLMTKMLDKEKANEEKVELSSRYNVAIKINESHDEMIVMLTKLKKKKKGGAIKRPVAEGAFDKINEGELHIFMREVLIELFVYSNFFQFNGDRHDVVTSEVLSNDDKRIITLSTISSPGAQLALAQRQVVPSMNI